MDNNEKFVIAAKGGDLAQVKLLLNPSHANPSSQITDELGEPFDSLKVDIHYNEDEALRGAFKKRKYEMVKYLLTSPDLIKKANIRSRNDYLLVLAIERQQLDWVEYFLTSPDLIMKSNVSSKQNWPIRRACMIGNVPIVDFMLTSPTLKQHAKYDAGIDKPLEIALKRQNEPLVSLLVDLYPLDKIERFYSTHLYMPDIKSIIPLIEHKKLKIENQNFNKPQKLKL